jgi:carboxypeptidase PM20D1
VSVKSPDSAILHLQQFLTFQTISKLGEELNVADSDTFEDAKAFLLNTYRGVLTRPEVTVTNVSSYSMLIEWKGSDVSLDPVMLYGHYDVVPVGDETAARWSHNPFSGDLDDGYVGLRSHMEDRLTDMQ